VLEATLHRHPGRSGHLLDEFETFGGGNFVGSDNNAHRRHLRTGYAERQRV